MFVLKSAFYLNQPAQSVIHLSLLTLFTAHVLTQSYSRKNAGVIENFSSDSVLLKCPSKSRQYEWMNIHNIKILSLKEINGTSFNSFNYLQIFFLLPWHVKMIQILICIVNQESPPQCNLRYERDPWVVLLWYLRGVCDLSQWTVWVLLFCARGMDFHAAEVGTQVALRSLTVTLDWTWHLPLKKLETWNSDLKIWDFWNIFFDTLT